MNKVVIGITGHRFLTNAQIDKVMPVVKKAIQNIIFTIHEHEPAATFSALSPLAEGADTLFAKVAIELGLPLKVILPAKKDTYLEGFSSDKARSEFEVLYNNINDSDRYIIDGSGEINTKEGYLELGKQIVERTDYLIAIWNENPSQGKGGTADVVSFAMERQKNILLINPDDKQPHINYLHKDTYKHKHNKEIIDTPQTNHLLGFITGKLAEYESNATTYNKKYKRIWAFGFVIGLIEVLAFSVFISFHVDLTLHFVLASVEFLSIFTIILMVIFGNSKQLHSKYVHYRIVSERLRVKQFFTKLGLRIHHVVVSPIYISFKEKPEYNILDNTIKLNNLCAYSYLPFEEKKHILESELILDQYHYHEGKMEKFEKKNNLYKNVRQALFLTFASAVTFHFAHVANEFLLHHHVQLTTWDPAIFHSELFEHIIIFISIFIPATIAASEALKYLYEWEKIITLSAAMAKYFKEKAKKLAHVHTEEALENFINSVNKDMLIENLDWEKYMHDKNEVPT